MRVLNGAKRAMGRAVVSPFLMGLQGLLRSSLSSGLAPIGILAVIDVPRVFHIRLSEALVQRAGWLGRGRSESPFDAVHEHLATLASGMLREDQRPIALVVTEGRGTIRVVPDRQALRACALRPRTLTRLEPMLIERVRETLLTASTQTQLQ